jgi:hypothetical protein
MPARCRAQLIAATLLLTPLGAFADDPVTAAGSDAGIGLDIARAERSFEVDGLEADTDGTLGGVHAFLQRGDLLRAEARLLGGSLESEAGGQSDTGNASLLEVRATLGTSPGPGRRFYAGVGIDRLAADSPFGSGDATRSSIYLPFGVAGSGRFTRGWHALVTLEGRFVVASEEEIDGIPGVGDADFDSAGGYGAEFSVHLRNNATGVAIEPYLQYMAPADSDETRVGATRVEIRDASRALGGVRLSLSF